MRINFGSGKDYREGYLNCDISNNNQVDKIVNIEKRLPFKDNSVDEILLRMVLEHTQKPIEVMKEIYRICKNKAKVKIIVPYFSCENAFSNITHYHQFSYTSFDLFETSHSQHWQGCGNFKIIKKELHWRKFFYPFQLLFSIHPKITRIYQEFFCWIIPARELEVWMEVIK
jgi:SAM-dependent methyltransferase